MQPRATDGRVKLAVLPVSLRMLRSKVVSGQAAVSLLVTSSVYTAEPFTAMLWSLPMAKVGALRVHTGGGPGSQSTWQKSGPGTCS